MSTSASGEKGEALAARYYRRRGYRILHTNYRTRQGEIDIIAEGKGTLVFAEVKTRGPGAIARPGEWVGTRKQQRLMLAAGLYLAQHSLCDPVMRFDVVEVEWSRWGKVKIHCIENAFTA